MSTSYFFPPHESLETSFGVIAIDSKTECLDSSIGNFHSTLDSSFFFNGVTFLGTIGLLMGFFTSST
jgi:hypothetical protein